MNSNAIEVQHLSKANKRLQDGFLHLPAMADQVDYSRVETIMKKLATRMQDNYPYHHAFYLGQMLKPPHPIARVAYQNAMLINPNNHALDGGRASSDLEKQVVVDIGKMLGLPQTLGHLTSGGTMANLEALWVAREETDGRCVLASEQAHYTHSRLTNVLGLSFDAVPADPKGRMCMRRLEKRLSKGDVGTVVVTMGTTALGAVDPLADVLALRAKYDFRVHVDAAYGGYFILDESLGSETRRHFDWVAHIDSISIDPHKHGLQPYGCGCILFSDPAVGRHYKHDSPYTYFSSTELHLGEISLECSRAGAAACALWATMQYFPLVLGGEFADRLTQSRAAAKRLKSFLLDDNRFRTPWNPELDIVVWMPKGTSARDISAKSAAIFERAAQRDVHLALCKVPKHLIVAADIPVSWDDDHITCLRACLMKPEHEEYFDAIADRLAAAFDDALETESLQGARHAS
ncbi:pyridoxal phosphate-dependent decarboxylase family protein [Salinisphaera sp.]|uniref:pyridoxal phosphate-dependent decarboxylase family protein n=1 Tax=Salinisphaera sp. TaxID=1914330 RepID=UPI002D788A56|nr:aminotransferase class V-fold PLP-dependent enzyme [Salinisphaera sp.]HET7312933.1 aminotransferase class V-fold PLP-dependent enzyme [Salinisphaera sp.]